MAELALAIVPIFFGAVRGFFIIREKTHLLRHYHKEIRRLRDKVDVQSRCFRGEIYHLIIDTLDDHTAQLLIRDDNHAYWKSQDLEGTLGLHLGELRPGCWKAIDEIKSALLNIEARLSVFAEPDVTVSHLWSAADFKQLNLLPTVPALSSDEGPVPTYVQEGRV